MDAAKRIRSTGLVAHNYSEANRQLAELLRELFPEPNEPAKDTLELWVRLLHRLNANVEAGEKLDAWAAAEIERYVRSQLAEERAKHEYKAEASGELTPESWEAAYHREHAMLESLAASIANRPAPTDEKAKTCASCGDPLGDVAYCDVCAEEVRNPELLAKRFHEPTDATALANAVENEMNRRGLDKPYATIAAFELRLRQAEDDEKALREALEGWEQFREEFENLTYHSDGMGCGIEDRGITDRYAACEYGWDRAINLVREYIPESIDKSILAHEAPKDESTEEGR
jgi:hypothetical protein